MALFAAVRIGSEGFTKSIEVKFQYENSGLGRETRGVQEAREKVVVQTMKQDFSDLALEHLTEQKIEVI